MREECNVVQYGNWLEGDHWDNLDVHVKIILKLALSDLRLCGQDSSGVGPLEFRQIRRMC
jgi:hypothetical protein